eukprot:scaffold263402_cov32-Tisochrysis_lutea.AAC.4
MRNEGKDRHSSRGGRGRGISRGNWIPVRSRESSLLWWLFLLEGWLWVEVVGVKYTCVTKREKRDKEAPLGEEAGRERERTRLRRGTVQGKV